MPAMTDAQREFLHRSRVGRLGTVDASGEAFLVPVCYALDAERIYTPIDEKPKRSDRPLKRVRNVQETGRATLVVDYYEDEDWSRLAWVMLRGTAEVISPGHELHDTAIHRLRERYRQYQEMALESAQVIVLRPDRVVAWGLSEGED